MNVRLLLATLLSLGMAFCLACGGDDASSGNGGASAPTAAADGSTAGGGGATLQDACTLLSDEQVAVALGDDRVVSMKGEPPTEAVSTCQWEGSKSGDRYVAVSLRTAQDATAMFASDYRTADGAVSVSGIGDEAYALIGTDTPNNYRFLTMAALTSSLFIQVNIAGQNRSDEEALSSLTTTMQQVVGNLN